MKNWPDDVFERLAGLADELWFSWGDALRTVVDQHAEDLLVDVSQDLEEFVTSFVAFSQDVGTEVQATLDRTLEQSLGQSFEQILSQTFNPPAAHTSDATPDAVGPQPVNLGPLLNQLMSELVQPLGHTWGWDDMPNSVFAPLVPARHQVCTGCQHYNGQVYGGNLLVCGMYPYGQPEGAESCPDRQLDPRPSSTSTGYDFWML
jgi:hypothetical protein